VRDPQKNRYTNIIRLYVCSSKKKMTSYSKSIFPELSKNNNFFQKVCEIFAKQKIYLVEANV